jgi:hypothetical protein
MSNDYGVIYIATGELFNKMAAMSAISVKNYCPGLPVHIFTDRNMDSYSCFDSSTIISDPHARSKVDYLVDAPFQKTLFLDADTRVCEDITPMFDLLDRFELAMTHDAGRERKPTRYLGEIPKIFVPLNSGVILFKKTEPVIKFFNTWKDAYHNRGIKRDQISLREQLWISDIKLWILPHEYNCGTRGFVKVFKSADITPKIMHLYDYKVEAGLKPKYLSMPFLKRMKYLLKRKIKNPIKRHFSGVPYS